MKLITDRTLEDVLAGNEKGRYTAFDLNRVEQAVEMLCSRLDALGTRLELQTNTRWEQGEYCIIHEEMDRYLENIRKISNIFLVDVNLPESMEKLDHNGANRIELALEQGEKRLRAMVQIYQMSGELFAGEENGI